VAEDDHQPKSSNPNEFRISVVSVVSKMGSFEEFNLAKFPIIPTPLNCVEDVFQGIF